MTTKAGGSLKSAAMRAAALPTGLAVLGVVGALWAALSFAGLDPLTGPGALVLAVGAGACAAAAGVVGFALRAHLGAHVVDPIGKLAATVSRLAAGDRSATLSMDGRQDEIGRMAREIDAFRRAVTADEERRAEADAARAAEADAQRFVEGASEAGDHRAALAVIAEGVERLAAGELAFRVTRETPPTYSKLREDLNRAFETLESAMAGIGANADAVRAAATDIAGASDDLSRRTESQAASLEESAAAIEEITATTRSTADNAGRARDVVEKARDEAAAGGDIAKKAVVAMREIAASSEKIGQIIGLIDEIAFQTNLLALNAGVEAARAGEDGKGFAVVASEVRALAGRTADSANEIKALILRSKEQVDSGVELVDGAGDALGRIIAGVAEIEAVVGEIATSAQEQATGLQEVNGAVSQMDQFTQQNAAMVEQATTAVRALSRQTDEFARLIGRFRVDQGRVSALKAKMAAAAPAMVKTAPKAAIGGGASKPKPVVQSAARQPAAQKPLAPKAAASKPSAIKPAAKVTPLRPRAEAAKPTALAPKPVAKAAPVKPADPKTAAKGVAHAAQPAAASSAARPAKAAAPARPAPKVADKAAAAPPPKRRAARAKVDSEGWEEF
jgi:methyl-accepting chemotaxis protein